MKLLLEIPRDHYKALDINTPIPTPDGFRRMGDIQVNDEVFAVNGAPTKVTAVSPIMVTIPNYTRCCKNQKRFISCKNA